MTRLLCDMKQPKVLLSVRRENLVVEIKNRLSQTMKTPKSRRVEIVLLIIDV